MNDELFAGIRPVRPVPALRARVLAAAAAVSPRPAWWQVLGFGRWDLAWVGAAVLLAVVHIALGRGDRPATVAARLARDRDVVALARELGLPENALRVDAEPVGVPEDDVVLQHILDERI